MKYIIVSALALLWALCVSTQTSKNAAAPHFEDFPETEKWSGTAAKVRIDTPAKKMFRTQFRDAARQAPNFAGHYRITTWGCGTDCFEGGMVDLETGTVSVLPSSMLKRGWEYRMMCYSAFQPSGIESRADSRLLIIRCANAQGSDGGAHLCTFYFVFENGSFKKIAENVDRERVF